MSHTKGLAFRKLDLHVHTPASNCYEYKEHTPETIVEAALKQGLDGIAITDHNTAAWIDAMQAAAEGTSLTIFPGVEISTHEGYHVVALFDVDKGQGHVESFLGAIDILPEHYGQSDRQCEKSIYDVFETILKRNGLAILAHIDGPRGAFHELTSIDADTGRTRVPATCARLFSDARYHAVEVIGDGLPEGLDCQHHVKREPAFYKASDNPCPDNPIHHAAEGIGTRYSWFKLDEICLEGLRQCFADAEVRIQQMDQLLEQAGPRILRMRVGEEGFLAYQRFRFHPGLNSIVGGKGVGKSLAIEFLRFALEQASQHPEIRRDHQGKLEHQLGALNTVEVEIELANGVRYVIRRKYQGNGDSTFSCRNVETGEEYAGDVARLFPILAYSQTEVIKIAEDEGSQLRLIDSLIDPQPFQTQINGIQEELSESDRLVAEGLAARVHAEDHRQELATLREEIANIDRVLSSPLLTRMKAAEAKREAFETQIAYLDDLAVIQADSVEEISEREPPPLPETLKDDPTLEAQRRRSESAREVFLDALAEVARKIEAERQQVVDAQADWEPTFEEVREEYEEALRGSDRAQLETRRREKVEQATSVERELERYRKMADEALPQRLAERGQLLDQLDQVHQAYYETRKAKFDHLTQASGGKLKLLLEHASNRSAYTEALVSLLSGSGTSTISPAQRRLVAREISPRALGQLIIDRNVEGLAEQSGLTPLMAERAMDKLWAHDDLPTVLSIQHADYPEDVPSIQFNKGDDRYAELSELSVGQKCTAMLIVALCDGDMPVIIDQPEDALDIASVWEDIVKKLRGGKCERQFILTTHNASLAVGSDSDKFIVLTPMSGDRAKVAHRGAIDRDDVRRAVIDHLEGGNEAYKLRQRKYNIK